MPDLLPIPVSRRTTQWAGALLGAPAILAALLTCTDAPTPTGPVEPRPVSPVAADAASGTVSSQGTIPLPIYQTVSSSSTAFGILQNGLGPGAYFQIGHGSNSYEALRARTIGTGHAAVFESPAIANYSSALYAWTSGRGAAGEFSIISPSSFGPAIRVTTRGRGTAARLTITNSLNYSAAIYADTRGTGSAGVFGIINPTSVASAVEAMTVGLGTALRVRHQHASCTSTPTACNLAVFSTAGVNQIRFGRLGRGYFNGGTQTGGADVAEAFSVEGRPSDYEPGDVLVISTKSDQRLERSREPYSTLVAGVYATKPGVLLTERHIDASLDDTVPLGVIGVIPTKVSAENGAIRRGDLLVTARTPGHAMRADPDRLRVGTSLGKALEVFTGPGTGVIRVLVNVK